MINSTAGTMTDDQGHTWTLDPDASWTRSEGRREAAISPSYGDLPWTLTIYTGGMVTHEDDFKTLDEAAQSAAQFLR